MKFRLAHPALSAAAFVAIASLSTLLDAMPAVPCADLAALKLPDTTITLANEVTGGSLTVAVPPAFTPRVISGLPPFCRVGGVIKPTSDSNILFEVWLPLTNWNGRFAGTGNGTTAGSIIYAPIGSLTDSLAVQLARGYAVANSDMGHPADADPARFGYDHPEQLIDFGTRATHELTLKGKAITAAFYGIGPHHSYWYGCSTGGRQGLMEAQRFPDDYDGIVAGSPADNFNLASATALDNAIRIQNNPAANLTQSKGALLAAAVLNACDAKDGLVDGLIDDPRRCNFDLGSLLCKTGLDPNVCLTPEQADAARQMYAGLSNPATGAPVYPGREFGSEGLWSMFTVGPVNAVATASYAKWIVFGDPNWDWTTFDFRHPQDFNDFFASDARLVPILNSLDPDMRAFRQRGGKLVQYHGWADNNPIAPRNSINYFNNVVSFLGEKPDDFYRLFMVPGMSHCYSPLAPGPNVFDMVSVMEDWVEQGVAPTQIVASHVANGVVDRTRPLCSYPAVARWTGNASTDDAANFVCVPPVDLKIVPGVIDMRSTIGVVAVITLGGGFDPGGWKISDVKLAGVPAFASSLSFDGRTLLAKFYTSTLANVLDGTDVTLPITGVMEKNGTQVPFASDTSVQVVR